jgi:lysophospholipase L1-like esterase
MRLATPWIMDSGIQETFSFAQPEFDYEVRTNSEGVRDVEHPIEKPEREYRIVALGDSFTMGQGACFEDAYPQVLERLFNEGASSGHIRVISAGVMGSDPVFCYHLLKRRLLKYRPDLVILLINDGEVEDLIARGGRDRFGPDGMLKNPAEPPFYFLFATSHIFRGIMMTFFQYDYYGLRPEERGERDRAALAEILAVARDIRTLGDEEGFRLLLAFLPHRGQLLDRSEPLLLKQLEPLCTQEGIEYFDVTDFLRSRLPIDRVEEHFWPKDGHFNAAGYALLAQGIRERICEKARALDFPWKDGACP